jgi:alpha-glucosidase
MAHFPFNFQMCSLRDEKKFNPKELKNLIQDYVEILPKKSWPNWQLGNHDIPRIASRIGNQYINLANALNLLLGGTPIVYYGEEIGMEDLPTMHLKYEDCRDEFGKRHGV